MIRIILCNIISFIERFGKYNKKSVILGVWNSYFKLFMNVCLLNTIIFYILMKIIVLIINCMCVCACVCMRKREYVVEVSVK